MQNRVVLVLAVATMAGCAREGASSTEGTLVASAAAQAHGVAAYRIDGEAIDLVDSRGATIGVLEIAEPSATKREVTIAYVDGGLYTDEIEPNPNAGPMETGRFLAPVLEDREGAVQADPALAAVFSKHGLVFAMMPKAQQSLAPTWYANCWEITWPTGCSYCGQNSPWPCNDYDYGSYSVAYGYASCPRVNCAFDGTLDVVEKKRTCYTALPASSCTQQALGWIYQCATPGQCDS